MLKSIAKAFGRPRSEPPKRPFADLSGEALIEAIRHYNFYHCVDLGNGLKTPGWTDIVPMQVPTIAEISRHDLRGKRVLDVGCCDGLFGFQAERQGAAYVLGIDNSLSKGATEFLIPWLDSAVQMREINLYDFEVEPQDRFDFVSFSGVLYHLRLPYFGLKRLADAMRPGATMVLETALLLSHSKFPFLYSPKPEDSPYEPSSVTFFNHLGLVAALESFGFVDVECRAVFVPQDDLPTYPGWEAFLDGRHGYLAESPDIKIGRGTYCCRLEDAPAEGANVSGERRSTYWYGIHRLNGQLQHD